MAGSGDTLTRGVVCIYATEEGHWPILEPIKAMLSRDGRFRVVDLSETGAAPAHGRPATGRFGRLKHALRPFLLTPIVRRRIAAFESRLRAEKANLVIVAEDNVASSTRLMVTAAKRMGARVMIAPFTIPNPREAANAARARRGHELRRPRDRRFAQRHPHWALRVGGATTLLRLPLPEAARMQRLGLSGPAPWLTNRGAADAVAVESEAMARLYRKLDFPEDQIVLTGSPSDDVLARASADRAGLKARLAGETGIDPGRPLLVFAFPPDQFAEGFASNAQFATFGEMKSFFTNALSEAARTFAIVIRPHPRLDQRKLEGLPAALSVSHWNTAQLVALCDLYVATGSATTRWAIAAGKPVLEYDVFRYRLDDYTGVPGVVSVDDPEEFRSALRRAANDPAWLRELAESQAKVAGDWGRLDGRSCERIATLAWRLVSGNSHD